MALAELHEEKHVDKTPGGGGGGKDEQAPATGGGGSGEAAPSALIEVNAAREQGRRGPTSTQSSHFSHLSSAGEAGGLLHLVLVTLGVYRSTLGFRLLHEESFASRLRNGIETSNCCFPPTGWWSQPGNFHS